MSKVADTFRWPSVLIETPASFCDCTVGDHNLNNVKMSLSGKNLVILE